MTVLVDSQVSDRCPWATCFCGCIGGFVSDLIGNSEDQFSHEAAHHYNINIGIN